MDLEIINKNLFDVTKKIKYDFGGFIFYTNKNIFTKNSGRYRVYILGNPNIFFIDVGTKRRKKTPEKNIKIFCYKEDGTKLIIYSLREYNRFDESLKRYLLDN